MLHVNTSFRIYIVCMNAKRVHTTHPSHMLCGLTNIGVPALEVNPLAVWPSAFFVSTDVSCKVIHRPVSALLSIATCWNFACAPAYLDKVEHGKQVAWECLLELLWCDVQDALFQMLQSGGRQMLKHSFISQQDQTCMLYLWIAKHGWCQKHPASLVSLTMLKAFISEGDILVCTDSNPW
jgi:hypothetical protein